MTGRAQVIIDWISQAGWDTAQEIGYPLFQGQDYAETSEPDRAVFITLTTGPGYVTEEMSAEAWGFQARLRGPSDDPDAADAAMGQLDALIAAAGQNSTDVDGVRILRVSRLAGPPSALPLNPEDRRFEWTCSYIAVTSPVVYVGV